MYFVLGLLDDPYTFGKPCPPTVDRVAKYDAARTTKGEKTFAKSLMGASIPDSDRSNFLVSPAHVKIEDGKLLRHTAQRSVAGSINTIHHPTPFAVECFESVFFLLR